MAVRPSSRTEATKLLIARALPWVRSILYCALLVLVAVIVLTACSSGKHKADPISGYGQSAATVATSKLHLCSTPTMTGEAAGCDEANGNVVAVTTTDSKDEQDDLVSILINRSPNQCHVVLTGVVISALDKATLTEALGDPDAFATDHHGYLLCFEH
jgi:hypothetical protein